MTAGTYLVTRRISMHIETWDRTSLAEQESVVGRTKDTGAPLSGGDELTEPDFEIEGNDGPLMPLSSHVRLARPDANGGVRMLRRGYNFTDDSDGLGRLDAGLFFIAYVRDPQTQFVPMQARLAESDALAEYLVHTGSGLFAVPPGVRAPGASIGDPLFT
jgi:deferrochelatase/peroxidase EfeB